MDILWVLLASGAQTGGAFSCLWELCPEDSGPPPHWYEQDEHFYVVPGQIRDAVSERVVVAGPGTTARVLAEVGLHRADGPDPSGRR